ncbi:class I SAM-dependent methyltransferase [Oceanobacillus sp. ISL-73]|uniref:class I SAM-dependent methyltransferase n=1 Tax=Oceanobacillus sp. ISL-73 TaxID=2819161 RepID=UPI001BEAB856|nr:class I SAM-dependent methyltransferase [Oceanobacillus sp. ISL-73]MBT2653042.1 methyltransferase domain-containing protein [Oceanobacillus sp. ISL-73]
MKQNKYDDPTFFKAYAEMARSRGGLAAAGEWPEFQKLLPEMGGKSVLDLGCGYGWHCRYARTQGASTVVGIDISEKMLTKANELTNDDGIRYVNSAIEDMEFSNQSFDIIISSLAFHYIQSFDEACAKVYNLLKKNSTFIFSVEHPIFTSRNDQDWIYISDSSEPLYWAVDNYQYEGKRKTSFLTGEVIKYHRTLSTYINQLIKAGFRINNVVEPGPTEELICQIPEMVHENRRPMFLLIAAEKRE